MAVRGAASASCRCGDGLMGCQPRARRALTRQVLDASHGAGELSSPRDQQLFQDERLQGVAATVKAHGVGSGIASMHVCCRWDRPGSFAVPLAVRVRCYVCSNLARARS